MYYYFYELIGEPLIPYTMKILTSKKDVPLKVTNFYKSQEGTSSELFNPLETFF